MKGCRPAPQRRLGHCKQYRQRPVCQSKRRHSVTALAALFSLRLREPCDRGFVVASVSLFGVWIHKKGSIIIIIIILDMIIIIVTITFIIIIVIIRGSSHYATCMPLPSDTFHHNIWGRR